VALEAIGAERYTEALFARTVQTYVSIGLFIFNRLYKDSFTVDSVYRLVSLSLLNINRNTD